MTLPMIIALAVTVLMIILIMVDKLPFGAPPLLALLLLVVFGVTDIKTAFGGFANPTIVMLASFMAIIAALQKTSFFVKFKQTMFNMASKGGFKAYVLLILIVMLGCSLFGTGSTAYYVLVIGLLSTLPYSKQLPPSRVLMPAGFAANHPLLPFNTALQYGIVIAVLESAGVAANVNLVKFSLVNLCLSIGFLVWCILAYKILPDHPIAEAKEEALQKAFVAEDAPCCCWTAARQKPLRINTAVSATMQGCRWRCCRGDCFRMQPGGQAWQWPSRRAGWQSRSGRTFPLKEKKSTGNR